jgi:hypothetical protein
MIPKKIRRKRSDALPEAERKRRHAESQKKWDAAHPEAIRDKNRRWQVRHRAWKKEWIRRNHDRVRAQERAREKIKLRERKQALVNAKGGCCCKCGYNKCLAALEFHHRDRASKTFEVSARNILALSQADVPLLFKEAEKCDLLCANCHREHHCL